MLLILIAFLSLRIIVQMAALAPQNIVEDFRKSWLRQQGTQPNATETKVSLWIRGTLRRLYNLQWQANTTNSGPLRYYLSLMTNDTPKVTNSTTLNGMYQDPRVLADSKVGLNDNKHLCGAAFLDSREILSLLLKNSTYWGKALNPQKAEDLMKRL